MSDDTSNEIAKAIPSKAEAVEFTANLRDAMDTLCDAAEVTADLLRKSQEKEYWSAMGYDTWKEWYEEEFEDQITFLQNIRLSLDTRIDIVQSLTDGGLSNRAIAASIGVSEKTIRNDVRRIELSGADVSASNEVDAAGQSVEEVGHIDERERHSLTVPAGEQLVIGNEVIVDNTNNNEDPFKDRFADIDFGAMILNVPPQQIIQAQPSDDTPDYFVPRSVAPSWSPPTITELPPSPAKAYDVQPDNTPEFLEPPMKLQKAGEANKTPEDKHCKTCACNLLP